MTAAAAARFGGLIALELAAHRAMRAAKDTSAREVVHRLDGEERRPCLAAALAVDRKLEEGLPVHDGRLRLVPEVVVDGEALAGEDVQLGLQRADGGLVGDTE